MPLDHYITLGYLYEVRSSERVEMDEYQTPAGLRVSPLSVKEGRCSPSSVVPHLQSLPFARQAQRKNYLVQEEYL
jgi:hypothetical protein